VLRCQQVVTYRTSPSSGLPAETLVLIHYSASSLYTPPPMFAPRRVPPDQRHLDLEEIRLISDLRIMHAKVDELYQLVCNLRKRHSESDIVRYADEKVLAENIRKVDELYLWFVNIKEERDRSKGDYRKLP
jgi:hypothetical protein